MGAHDAFGTGTGDDRGRLARRVQGNQTRSAAADPLRRYETILAKAAARRPQIDAKRSELERLWRAGASNEQIARATGYSPTSVQAIANLCGLLASDRKGRRS